MKKITPLFLIFLLLIVSCFEDADDSTSELVTTFNFSHNWDGTPVTNADFNLKKFTNANGEELSIERLRYLISKITFTSADNQKMVSNNYNLVDVTNNKNTSFIPEISIPAGSYSDVTFTFGFNNEDNSGNYEDLNSASWFVPAALGGGYHYMQFDGKFGNASGQDQGFNYHAIRAVDNPGDSPTFPQDTFFTVSLGPVVVTGNTVFNIEMNIAEWFKTPNTWDLNVLNQMLMPNSDAQIMMHENGQNVFSLKSIN